MKAPSVKTIATAVDRAAGGASYTINALIVILFVAFAVIGAAGL